MTPSQRIGELMGECDEHAEQYFHGLSDVPPEPYGAFRNAILDAFNERVSIAAAMLLAGATDADLIAVPCSKFVREGAAERVRGVRVIRESGVRV